MVALEATGITVTFGPGPELMEGPEALRGVLIVRMGGCESEETNGYMMSGE
jgi:hypothetical protein